jgi:Na+/proline symporter
MMCQLPVGVSGLLIAAVFAAAMSTLASNINSATTVLSEDFYAKWHKGVSDAGKVRFARVAGILIGGLGVLMALALATFDIASLWDQFNFFLGLLTSGLGGLFLMGIAARRIGAKAALTGFVGSVIVLLLIHALTAASPILYGFLGLVSCFLIGYLSSFLYGYGR